MRKLALVTAIVFALALGAIGAPSAHAQQRNPGISTVCGEYKIVLFVLLTPLGPIALGPEFPDEGWAYVDGSRKRVQATGIAHNVKLRRDIEEGERLKWSDVEIDETDLAVRTRREMEAAFARPNA